MKLSNTMNKGITLVVQMPHTRPCGIYSYHSLDEAFKAWIQDCHFVVHNNLEDFKTSLDGCDEDFIESQLEAVAQLDTSKAFMEFSLSPNADYVDFYQMPINQEDLLLEMVQDDMARGFVFVADGNETYQEFVDRVYNKTRGHNEPRKSSIMLELGILEED